jgi:uncharacterized protein (DUF433 family)
MVLDRITIDPRVMGGKPCLRGMRVTVGTVVGMLAEGHSAAEILELYPIFRRKTLLKPFPMRHCVRKNEKSN